MNTSRNNHPTSGFTLIETSIYLALFGLIIAGGVIAAYQIFEFAGRNQTRAMMQEEGDFIIAKMGYALSGAQTVGTPAAPSPNAGCASSSQLSVTKWDTTAGNPLIFSVDGGNMLLSRSGNPGIPLNNSNVSVSDLVVTRCWPGPSDPESIAPHFTISARTPSGALLTQDFFTTVYLRK